MNRKIENNIEGNIESSGDFNSNVEKGIKEPEEKDNSNIEDSYISPKDDFEALGISANANEQEIKKAYRNMAKAYHPDKNPGNKKTEERFKRGQEAYENIMRNLGDRRTQEELIEEKRREKIEDIIKKCTLRRPSRYVDPKQLWDDRDVFLKSEVFLNAKDPWKTLENWTGKWFRDHQKEVEDHKRELAIKDHMEEKKRKEILINKEREKMKKVMEKEREELENRNAVFRAEEAARKEAEKNNPPKPKSFFKRFFGG